MLAKIENGVAVAYPYYEYQIRADFPGRSLTDNLEVADLTDIGVVAVIDDPAPTLAPGQFADLSAPVLIGGVWRRQWTARAATAEEFAARKAELLTSIDTGAGQFRLRFITSIPGQDATYKIKGDEAVAFAADPNGSYPYLEADAAATGRTIADVAAEISGISAQWTGLNAQIEARRVAAKRNVEAATAVGNWTAMEAAAAINWEALLA